MTLLILGLILWWIVHTYPLVAKPSRDAMVAKLGEGPYKGAYSLAILLSIVLMVIGYRGAEFVNVYFPPAWGMHLTDLLMLVAVFLLGASHSRGNVKRVVRHPMLLATLVWAIAHLVVNGDLASVALFGGLGLWAVVAIFATNARDGAWVKPAPAPRKKDVILVGITIVAYLVIGLIHGLIGPSPFPGG